MDVSFNGTKNEFEIDSCWHRSEEKWSGGERREERDVFDTLDF